MRKIANSIALCAVLTAFACDKSPETKSPPSSGGDQASKTEAKPEGGEKAPEAAPKAGEKTLVVEGAPAGGDDRYALKIETPEATAGQESKVTVRVVPKDPWHMNLDYPTSLAVQSTGGAAALAKDKLKKDDGTISEKECSFDVAFTPKAAGDANFSGEFKFAVCQDEACAPVTENIEFKVAVK
jgi:hypothetical protein